MRLSRAELVLPRRTISSAKLIELTLMEPRSIPSPVELSSRPRLLIKRENSRGLRLQPISLIYFQKQLHFEVSTYLVSHLELAIAGGSNDH